ncbi:MAG TPA: hypothetical protein VMI94_27605 [Bryobacteraceae bacterium]|nr:hypothetical protein [Bryobacteraceae bacterium]
MRKVCHHNWAVSTDGCTPDGTNCVIVQDTQRVVCYHTRFEAPCDQATKCLLDNARNVILDQGESVVCHHYDFKEFGATCDCDHVDNSNVKKVRGLLSLVLYPQTDPNPPHNVHPTTDRAVFDWIADHQDPPVLWIRNASGRQVWLYTRRFYKDNTAPTDLATSVPPANSNLDHQSVSLLYGSRYPTTEKIWYGFAFQGEYANPGAYFADHPAGGGHHTQNIPPSSS